MHEKSTKRQNCTAKYVQKWEKVAECAKMLPIAPKCAEMWNLKKCAKKKVFKMQENAQRRLRAPPLEEVFGRTSIKMKPLRAKLHVACLSPPPKK